MRRVWARAAWLTLSIAIARFSSSGFATVQAQTAPSTYSAYTGTDTRTIPPPPALGPANSVITDPTFGSRILRVTDQNTKSGESFISIDGGSFRAWNADSSAIKLSGPHGDGYWLEFNANTFKVGDGSSSPAIHPLPFGARWEWSAVDPNVIYFLNGNQIASYNKSTGVTTNLGGPPNSDPVAYFPVVVGQDNWICAAAGSGPQDSYTEIFCVNPVSTGTSKFIDVLNKTINGVPQGDPNWPTPASGQTLGIHGISGGTGASWLEATFHGQSWGANGGTVFDLGTNTWSLVTNADFYWSGHVAMGNGKYTNGSGSVGGQDSRGYVVRDPDNLMNSSSYLFTEQPTTPPNNWCDSEHPSWLNSIRNPNAPLLISRFIVVPPCQFAWSGEIVAAAVDGSKTVWRFAHNHSTGSCYYGEGFAQISDDGNWALFSSFWEGQLGSDTAFGCFTRIDTFIVQLSGPPPPAITTTSLPIGTQNVSYTAALSATAGVTPYTWSIASGTLPPGLSLSSHDGTITGIPTTLGTSTFTVQVLDAVSHASTAALNIAIAAAQDVTPPSVPTGLTATEFSPSQINLSWTASTDNVAVTGYLIERCQGAGCANFAQIAAPAGTGTTFSDTSLTTATSYSYRVRATDGAGNLSPYSNIATAATASGTSIHLVQHAGTDGGVSTSSMLSFDSNVSAGDFIAVAIRSGRSGETYTVTDSVGNTYRLAVRLDVTLDAPGGDTLAIYYAENVNGGSNTITVVQAVSATLRWAVLEYSGVATSNSLDSSVAAQSSGTTANSGNLTTTNADLLLGAVITADERAFTAGTGFGIEDSVPSGPNTKIITEDAMQAVAGTVAVTATLNTSDVWGAALAAFRAAPAIPFPDVTLTKTHIGSFSQGQTGATYTLTVSNVGTLATNGPVSVTDMLPTALTGTAISGTGWSCSLQSLSCTRSDSLAPGGNYPLVTLTVNVANNAPSSITNSAAVSGGGEVNTNNNNALDVTTISFTDTAPPSAPTNLTATAVTGSQISLNWGPSTDNVGVTGYLIERCIGAGCATYAQIAAPLGTGTTFSDTGLSAGTGYSYRVRATDAAGNLSAYSNLSNATTLATVSGLIAAYSLNEGTATTVADSSGNGLTGTLTGGASWGTGKYGSAVSLNGTTSYVDLGNPALLQMTGSMTISAWINSRSFPSDDAAVVSKRNSPHNGYQLDTTVDTGSRTVGFKMTDSQGSSMIRYGTTVLQLDTWYHVAGVYDAAAGTMNVYLNGQLDNGTLVGTITGTQQNSPLNVNIGQRPGSPGTYNFAGAIDEVRIYARALSQPEIQADMNAPLGTMADTPLPGSLTAAAVSGMQINLSWTASTHIVGVTGYLIERCAGVGCSTFAQIVAPAGRGTTFSDTGLTPATSYSYPVRVTDAAGNLSAYSNVSSVTTLPRTRNHARLRPDI